MVRPHRDSLEASARRGAHSPGMWRIRQAVWRNGQAPPWGPTYVLFMKQVKLGSQGLRVPAIGLGCMGMSDFYGDSSEAQNLAVLERAAAIGCTFWDTSNIYGPFTNEILLSKALKGRRDQIILATKFGVARGEDGSFQGI